jgi:death-on-curing protein
MRYLTLNEVLRLHQQVIQQSGGSGGVRDLGALESAVAQPRMTFNGQELYPTLIEKAASLGFSLIQNHPFIDGNKRIGHAAMETFLVLNHFEIRDSVDNQEKIILDVASGLMPRQKFIDWLAIHVIEISETLKVLSQAARFEELNNENE